MAEAFLDHDKRHVNCFKEVYIVILSKTSTISKNKSASQQMYVNKYSTYHQDKEKYGIVEKSTSR